MNAPGPLAPSRTTARYIGRRFGLRAAELAPVPVARGLCGRVWLLRSEGVRYALKELFWDDDQDEPEIKRRVRFETSARGVGVRCPESLPAVDGDYLCRLPPELGDVYVRLYSWVDGTLLDTAAGAAAWLGDTLGKLHRLRHPVAGTPARKFESAPTPAQWRELLAALVSAGTPWADELERLLPQVEDLAALVVPIDRDSLIMCHLDLTPANVLRTRSGFALVDWDNAGPGSAEQELASALMEWHGGTPSGVAATMAAYGESGGPGTVTGLSSFSAHLGAVIDNLHTQATVTIAADAADEHRTLANTKALQAMASLPTRSALNQVCEFAAGKKQVNPRP